MRPIVQYQTYEVMPEDVIEAYAPAIIDPDEAALIAQYATTAIHKGIVSPPLYVARRIREGDLVQTIDGPKIFFRPFDGNDSYKCEVYKGND